MIFLVSSFEYNLNLTSANLNNSIQLLPIFRSWIQFDIISSTRRQPVRTRGADTHAGVWAGRKKSVWMWMRPTRTYTALTRVLSLAHARERPNQFVGEQQPPTDSPVPFESNRSATTTNGRLASAARFVRTRALNEKSPFSARIGRDARDALYIAGWKLSFHLKSFREGIPMNLRCLYATTLCLRDPSTLESLNNVYAFEFPFESLRWKRRVGK